MRRRRGSGRFSGRTAATEESINPMEGVANLVDVMLVFACGLMLALITYWNLDVAGIADSASEIQQGQEITDVDGLSGENGDPMEDSSLEEYGKVYRDPVTGSLYLVTEDGK